jgi:hypothetical protein
MSGLIEMLLYTDRLSPAALSRMSLFSSSHLSPITKGLASLPFSPILRQKRRSAALVLAPMVATAGVFIRCRSAGKICF